VHVGGAPSRCTFVCSTVQASTPFRINAYQRLSVSTETTSCIQLCLQSIRMETRGQADTKESVEQPSDAAKQAFETASLAFKNKDFRKATVALVQAFACTNASVATFQVLLFKNNNISLCTHVLDQYTEVTSVDRQVLVMALAAADQEAPGDSDRLQTLRNAEIGLRACSFLLAVLQDRKQGNFGSRTNPELRAITSWRLYHYRAIFYSRMYIMHETKRDITKAYDMMKDAGAEDKELEGDYHEYKQYKGENKYGCVMCGKVGKLFKCSQCGVLSYCGKQCYRKHYKNGHKEFCVLLKGMVEEARNRGKMVEKK
jgi:hypothetical protein